MPENNSKHIGIGGDPAKHATWRLQGCLSADCLDAAGNLTDVRNEPESGQNLLIRPFLASAVHTAAPKRQYLLGSKPEVVAKLTEQLHG